MPNLQDLYLYFWTVQTHLVMSCRCGLHCIFLHFIKLPPVLWHHRTDSSSQSPKQTGMGCSTETVEANTNNRMTEFQPVLVSNHVCRGSNICTEKYISHDLYNILKDVLYLAAQLQYHRGNKGCSKATDVLSNYYFS